MILPIHTRRDELTPRGFDDLRPTGSMRAAFEAEQLSSRPPAPRPTRTTRSRARCHVAKPLLLLGRTTKYKWVGVVMVVIAVAIAVVALMPLLLPLPFARYRFLAACVLPLPAAALFVMLLLCVFVFLSHPVPKHRRSSLLMIELGGNAGTRAPTAHCGGCVYLKWVACNDAKLWADRGSTTTGPPASNGPSDGPCCSF